MEGNVKKLLDYLRSFDRLAVALSGGVDSALLTCAAHIALGDRVMAVTARSEMMSADEMRDAEAAARKAGVVHRIVDTHDLEDPNVARNDAERCYYCKKRRFQKLLDVLKKEGISVVADGSNLDDQGDYRPGLRAIEELSPSVVSPFMACGWTKADIRRQAKAWGLDVWDKPSAACLASRIEYGLALTSERLRAVERAEKILRPYAAGELRVRHQGNTARIEAEPERFFDILQHREHITRELRAIGFLYVTLDLIGYRRGSTNEVLGGASAAFS